MVKMPGKSNKPPRVRKRNTPASSETSLHAEEESVLHTDAHHPAASPASHYPPTYRDEGNNVPTTAYPPSTQQQQQQNGMGQMAPPMQFHPPKPVVENGFNHVGSLVEKDVYSRTLEHNAQIILQVNQAMADNRPDLVGDLMNQLVKNINFLSSAAEQLTPNTSPVSSSSSSVTASGESPTPSHGPARISQSPLPVRPHSQPATPPQPPQSSQPPQPSQPLHPSQPSHPSHPSQHVSPPPGIPQHQHQSQPQQHQSQQQQLSFQTPPPPSPNGQQFGAPQQQGYVPYGPPQARPLPVYSPLAQSTHGPGYSPKSPNVTPFPQQQQQTANGFPPPSRPMYNQGNSTQPQQQQQAFLPQQQQPFLPQQQSSSSHSMPPPQNYPYAGQTRGVPSYGPGPQVPYGYQQQEQPPDANFTSMPPPQMQPKRSGSTGHRPQMTQTPQGPVPDQRQMMYQQRPFDPYSQQQQQMGQGQGQGPQQHYGPGPPHHQMNSMNPMMQHPSAGPPGQYHMQQQQGQQGQFRAPAPPPGAVYGNHPSPGGGGGAVSS